MRRTGIAQAVRVFVDVFQGHGLGADMAAAEGVVRIALDRQDLLARVSIFRPQIASQRWQAR
jgi:hypothetical protein